jgi:beta-mannosidase
MLHDIVQKYDPKRLMLPTSASGPLEFLNIENKGKNHDVHGPWKYEGVKGHYHLYNASDSLLHSEFGVDGMSNPHTLKKFLSDKNLKVTNMNENLIWRHHGEWWDTYERDASIFGEIDSLEDFIKCSQFIQAEGLRYALEANRRRMFQNSGSIVWQFNEPWPNVSCTSIVDYYNVPKLAYYYVKEAYSPVHVSMKYESLLYNSGESFKGEVFVHNDLKEFHGSLSITVAGENGIIKEQKVREFEVSENQCKLLEEISFAVVSSGSWFTIKLDMNYEGQSCTNIYHFIVRDAQGKNINTEKVKLMLNEVFSNKTWP